MYSIRDIDIALGGDEFTRAELVLIARVADRLGVANLFLTEEATGRDAFAVLTEIALATQRIGLGTGIVNVFSRTPTAIAMAAASVLEVMGERTFNLGLGTSGKLLMRKFHGVEFDRPVSRMRETVRLAGGSLGVATPRDRLRIYVAGLSDRTLEVTGSYADGWLSIEHGADQLAVVTDAAAAAGRPKPAVSAYLYGGIGDDPRLRQFTRSTLAWYGTAYRRLFERYGYTAEMAHLCGLWAAGDREAARAAVPDRLLADTALLGDPADFLAQVGRFKAAGVDRPVLRLQGQLSAADCIAMLGRLAGAEATGSTQEGRKA